MNTIQLSYLAHLYFIFHSEEGAKNDLHTLVEVWKTGDEQKLENQMAIEEDSPVYEEFMDELLHKRNKQMAEKIETFLTEGEGKTYFVVVGAAHYTSETGIDNLLEEKGYKIK